ncbi:hypothetical protein OGH69_17030 [Flavobacterium sp. MFBS3-15]|uniref:hypothetical protein n=1 Tax=Flavobacterium sp. MFBS3-15 TaxID=2989816 RepID=UPI00223628AD|nr:hypothetical protein [Flavobacterium sp. MFBS3-15]MCW4470678.1 hypothetical protein [Flavobacterium sp. MFBS3-15]
MNYFMVGVPFLLGLIGFIAPECWYIGALFTILTGGFQFITGTGLLIDTGGKRIEYVIYFAGTILFFLLWTVTDWHYIIVLPPALALYLSILLYIEAKKEKP